MAVVGVSADSLHRATRPGQKSSDFLIVNRRREEESRNKMLERTNYYAQTAMQSAFEETTTISIKRNRLNRKLEAMRGMEDDKLEARRERLRQLFKHDEESFTAQILASEESREERLEKMKARMHELKQRREAERKQIVEEKLFQRWRNECDELRLIESKVLEEQVAAACAVQLEELKIKKQQDLEEKRYYDDLWEQDRQKKIAKEEAEKARHREMNAATVSMLEAQLEMLRKQAFEEERLKMEEAALMRQEIQMRQLEDERAHARKLAEQRIIRSELDKFNRMKIEQRAQEVQKSLELDLKIVNEFFQMDQEEAENRNRRRAELRKEMQIYREHLQEQQRIEMQREREIEKLQKEEEDKVWRKRAERWRQEQLARDRLMQEVLAGRKEQLKSSIENNRNKQEQMRIEREQVLKQMEAAQRIEAAERERKESSINAYRESLAAQMELVEERKRDARLQNERDAEAEKNAEMKYRRLLEIETQRAYNSARIRHG